MPPVSGGATGSSPWLASAGEETSFCALTKDPIDIQILKERLVKGEDGAVVTFEGVVRNHSGDRTTRFLDYECYMPVALSKMQEIGRQILETYPIRGITMVHRLGRLEISDTSVAILVAAAHRKPAYEASLEAINRLKRLVTHLEKGTLRGRRSLGRRRVGGLGSAQRGNSPVSARASAVLALLVLAAEAPLAAQQASDDPTFKVEVSLVHVLVTVKDPSGAPIADLQKQDFTVLDAGVETSDRHFRTPHQSPAVGGADA